MALINRTIPNLFGGVSQQPPSVRHVTQHESSDNCFPAISTGLRQRPPTKHIAKLTSTIDAAAQVHLINRSPSLRYITITRNGALDVFDLATGALQTLNTPDGVGYLACTTPREEITALTVADYTFIVNKSVSTALTATVGAGTLAGTVQTFSALPGAPAVGDIYKIEGDPTNSFSVYYVKWNGSVWIETVNPGQRDTIDATTMPFTLTKTGASTFTFAKATWPNRLTGDLLSSPAPSFITRQIKDVFFYRNRLGMLADENVILSRAGAPFTFWPETVTAVLDSDPVDASVSSPDVAMLYSAVPFNKDLMLFSDTSQFQFSAGDTLTPKTGRIDLVTSYQASNLCKPVGAGSQLFFGVDLVESTSIHEYFIDANTVSNTAADVTAHVPTYVPKNVFKLAACTAEDTVFALSLEARNKVFVYKFYWNNNQKVQSAWGSFSFDSTDTILFVEFINNTAYFVIQRADGVYLESMSLAANAIDSDLGFLCGLDRRTSLTGTYDGANQWTTWTLPYVDAGTFTVVLGSGFTDVGNKLTVTRPSTTTVRALGDWSAHACYVGRNFTSRLRLSEQFVRDQKDGALVAGILKLRRLFVTYANTGYFRVEVTPKLRDTYTYEYTGKDVGAAVIGDVEIHSGVLMVPVMAGSPGLHIDIVSDSYLPFHLQSVEWEAEFTLKSSRTG